MGLLYAESHFDLFNSTALDKLRTLEFHVHTKIFWVASAILLCISSVLCRREGKLSIPTTFSLNLIIDCDFNLKKKWICVFFSNKKKCWRNFTFIAESIFPLAKFFLVISKFQISSFYSPLIRAQWWASFIFVQRSYHIWLKLIFLVLQPYRLRL